MTAPPQEREGSSPPPVAYVMSRFPKLTETFILYEILAVEAAGQPVEIFPLIRQREEMIHAEAAPLVARARYVPFLSARVFGSQLHFLRSRPRAYLGALTAFVRDTIGSRRFLLGGLALFPKIVHQARLMRDLGVRHVHCHFASHPALAGFVIHRLTGIPYSFTAHGTDLHVDHHMLRRKTAEAAFVVAISEDNRTEIVDESGPWARDRTEVLHCGVDTTTLRPGNPVDGAVATQPQEEAGLRILCIGTLHEVKGQRHLVHACAELARAGVPFTCRLVGDGPDRIALERQAVDLGISDRVVFDGLLTRAGVVDRLAEADVLVAPSVPTARGAREGIPVVLMEAMSCGLPVVASRLSGIPELVRDEETGLLVPPGDGTAIAAALRRLSDDPALRRRLGAAARATVVADFDLAANARRLVERFRSSMAADRATGPADAAHVADPARGGTEPHGARIR